MLSLLRGEDRPLQPLELALVLHYDQLPEAVRHYGNADQGVFDLAHKAYSDAALLREPWAVSCDDTAEKLSGLAQKENGAQAANETFFGEPILIDTRVDDSVITGTFRGRRLESAEFLFVVDLKRLRERSAGVSHPEGGRGFGSSNDVN